MIINDINGLDVFADEYDVDSVIANLRDGGVELRFSFKSRDTMGVTVSENCALECMGRLQQALVERQAKGVRWADERNGYVR